LGREEGLLVGASSGTAIAAALRVARDLGPDDLVVVLLPDSGRSYLSKNLSDDWLRRYGFLEEPEHGPTVRDALGDPALPTVAADVTVRDVLERTELDPATAVPVVRPRVARPYGLADAEILGSVRPDTLRSALASGVARPDDPVLLHAGERLPTVGVGESVPAALASLGEHGTAVVLRDGRALTLVTADRLAAVESVVD
jgi:cystathionine beta-synthase